MSEAQTTAPPTFASLLAVGLTFALLVGLGTWQLQRKVWKDGILAAIDARAKLPPVEDLNKIQCAPDAGLLDPCDFRPVTVFGRFWPTAENERHVFISVPPQSNSIGGPGFWVFAPFKPLAMDGRSIAVNRGFVPQARKAAADRVEGSASGDITVTGILRRAELRAWSSGRNDTAANIYFVRDPAELFPRCSCGLSCRCFGAFDGIRADYYIDMTGPIPASNLPFPMVGKIALSNRHLEYALTWYALAATLLVIAFFRFRPNRNA
jgi:surfeit locus 1 family protein